MIPFTIKKQLDSNRFNEYLLTANTTNQFTNYGYAVPLLEERARTTLNIVASKVVIATSSGTSGQAAVMNGINNNIYLNTIEVI